MKTLLTFLFCCVSSIISFSQGLTLPYSTGFDSPAQKTGWQQYRTGFLSGSNWTYSTGGFSGTCVSHDYNVGGNSTDTVIDWFVSPALNFTTAGTIALKVKTFGFSNPFPDSFEILVGTNKKNPSIGNYVVVANLSYMMPQSQWLDTTINIPITSDSVYIALKYKTIGAYWSTYAFDNISVNLNPVSIQENNFQKDGVIFFPNPFNSMLTAYFDDELLKSSLELKMYDLYGRKVKYIKEIKNKEIKISKDDLPAGLYFINVIQDHKTINTQKLIIAD